MKGTKFLFVTCCLEPSRANVLKPVIENLVENQKIFGNGLTVFDNGSTIDWVVPTLKEKFERVVVADRNVGYWTAIDWWLNNVEQDEFTYIIESDMIHYDAEKLEACVEFLTKHPDVGSVRLHKYSVDDSHLYDKDRPQQGSYRNIWQSHVNRVTRDRIEHVLAHESEGVKIYTNNFLTQLCALNRTATMKSTFDSLKKQPTFSEADFQRLYWESYEKTAILDGGLFHCDLGSFGKDVVTGSWTDTNTLNRIGYQNTRQGKILAPSVYNVTT